MIRPNRNEVDQAALKNLGISAVIDPYLEIAGVENYEGANRMLDVLRETTPRWLIATSTNALSFWQKLLDVKLSDEIAASKNLLFAAIGEQTKEQLIKLGASEVLLPDIASSRSLASQLETQPACKIILPGSNIAMDEIPNRLTPKGFEIISEVVYQTSMVESKPASSNELTDFDAVVLRSPSAARAFIHYNPEPSIPIICGGRTTASQLSRLGIAPSEVSDDPSPSALAQKVFEYLQGPA